MNVTGFQLEQDVRRMEKVWKWQLLLQWGSLVLLVVERGCSPTRLRHHMRAQDPSLDPTVGKMQ